MHFFCLRLANDMRDETIEPRRSKGHRNSNRYTVRIEFPVAYRKQTVGTHSNWYTNGRSLASRDAALTCSLCSAQETATLHPHSSQCTLCAWVKGSREDDGQKNGERDTAGDVGIYGGGVGGDVLSGGDFFPAFAQWVRLCRASGASTQRGARAGGRFSYRVKCRAPRTEGGTGRESS
jgi:hypothetical protein